MAQYGAALRDDAAEWELLTEVINPITNSTHALQFMKNHGVDMTTEIDVSVQWL